MSIEPTGAELGAPAQTPASPQKGMFGITGSGDVSGFGGLVRGLLDAGDVSDIREELAESRELTRELDALWPTLSAEQLLTDLFADTRRLHSVARRLPATDRELLVRRRPEVGGSPKPYGGYFDEVTDALEEAYPGFADAIEKVVVDRDELTLHIKPERILEVVQIMRDDESLRFELCSSVSAVDYLNSDARRLHICYQLTSMTYRRRVRLEAAVPAGGSLPSVTSVYPTADWQERETYDMFGVIFTGHPNLTRILMPDDWEGHPQLKDYPLGGVPVEYKGAEIPPPDQRRVYQ